MKPLLLLIITITLLFIITAPHLFSHLMTQLLK